MKVTEAKYVEIPEEEVKRMIVDSLLEKYPGHKVTEYEYNIGSQDYGDTTVLYGVNITLEKIK